MPRLPRLALLLSLAAAAAFRAVAAGSAAAALFPDFKIYDASGRPWRAAREDWDGARQRAATDPVWQAWLVRERATVEAWMARHHDRVQWSAGWSHDFVSPRDASHLTWTEEIPGEDVADFHSPSDPHVPITPKLFDAWVRLFRENHASMMDRAAQLYRLTGDGRYAAWAASQLDFYTDHYLEWRPARGGARLFWQTLTEATNLATYAHTVRHLGDYVAPARREHWRRDFFLPEVEVLNGTYENIHNIACWHRSATAQVALLFGDEAMWHEAVDGPYGIRQQVAQGITADYLWVEQSFGYAGGVAQALTSLYTEAALYGRAQEFVPEMVATENLLLAPIYYRFPNGQLPNPADSSGIGRAPNRRALAAVARVLPTSIGLAAVAGRGRRGRPADAGGAATGGGGDDAGAPRSEWDLLLDPLPPAPPVAPLPAVVSHNLEATRMAIIKANGWQVFFHYGQITRSHTEAEALNFSATYGNTDITHDPGTVGYGSPLHLGYHTRGLAQNEPLVDGEGEDLGPLGERREWIIEIIDPHWPKRGELLTYAPARVSAAQPQYMANARAERTLAIDGNALVDTAVIATTDGRTHQLGLALHLQGRVRLPGEFLPAPNFADGRPEPYRYWQKVTSASYRDQAAFDVDYGEVVLHVTLAVPGAFTLWHASTPDIAPARRESFYLETSGTQATFTTTFAPPAPR